MTDSFVFCWKNYTEKVKNCYFLHYIRIQNINLLKENFNARNPATNELIYKPERFKVRFKPSKKLNKIVNE